MKIAGIAVGDRRVASARIRLYSLLEALPKEFSSSILSDFDNPEVALAECDILFVQKAAWRPVVDICRRAQALGKTIVYDIDDDFGVWPDMHEETLCEMASLITVDSTQRATLLRGLTQAPVHVLPCMIDLADDPARRTPHPRERLETACTFGNHDSVAISAQWLGMLSSRSVSPLAIGPPTAANLLPPGRFRQFRLDSFVSDLNEADLAILQHPNDALGNRKDNNRLIMAMSLGMPVITSQTQAYVETLKDVGFPELACSSSDDFLKLFDELAIRERRLEVGARFYEYAWENYSPGRIVNLFTQAISDAFR